MLESKGTGTPGISISLKSLNWQHGWTAPVVGSLQLWFLELLQIHTLWLTQTGHRADAKGTAAHAGIRCIREGRQQILHVGAKLLACTYVTPLKNSDWKNSSLSDVT